MPSNLKPEISPEAYINIKSKFLKYPDNGSIINYKNKEGGINLGLVKIGQTEICISKGTWSGDPIVNFYQCNRPDLGISTYRFGTNITVSKTTGFNHNLNINIITSEIRKFTKQKVLCFSLLSPSNKNKLIKGLVASINTKAKVTEQEPYILDFELENSTYNHVFISFPLSSSSKGIKLFDYSEFKKSIQKNDISAKFYELIDVRTPKSTFESIIKITVLFYNEYKDEYALAYHCKSGKDRTSMFDAVVQATLTYLNKIKKQQRGETTTELFGLWPVSFGLWPVSSSKVTLKIGDKDYEKIRKLACKFMMFGYLIGYYGTGYFGLKIGSNRKLAEYILQSTSLYDFYFGHAGKAKSSL